MSGKEADASRVAIITGAGSGLGRATAHILGASSVACVLVGRRADPLLSTSTDGEFPAGVLTVAADVASPEDRARIVAETLGRFGRIDILVNNAGTSAQAPLLTLDRATWREVMETNVEAMFFLSQAVLPTMRDQGFGRIINIGSVYGALARNNALYPGIFPPDEAEDGPVRQAAYHTSKGAVLNLTRDLAVAVAPWGVTVNTISPGMFMSELAKAIVSDEVVESLSRMTPLGRFGDPPEIGHAVKFLASDEASFITGAELPVDGGWSIW